jgi:NAD(P)-dependent dehydrogenase (short-subunit alcohol dehydrogenase family)
MKNVHTSQAPKDQVFLVTGGTSGVGQAMATGLAQQGYKVVLLSRTAASGQQGVRHLAAVTGNERAEYLVADLSLQSNIRQVSEEVKRRYDNLHGLVNAAGALFFEQQLTAEGIDKSFAVNYLSHFYLTTQLLELLQESSPARVLTVGGAPRFVRHPTLDLHDPQLRQHYSGLKALSQAMFARLYFTFALAKRLEGSSVTAVAFHPGLITSRLVQSAPWWLRALTGLLKPWEKNTCVGGVYLATAPELAHANGVFFDDKNRIIPINQQYDPALSEQLWQLSERLTDRPARLRAG